MSIYMIFLNWTMARFLLALTMGICLAHGAKISTFTAAVYEHALITPELKPVPLTRGEAVRAMMKNLVEYERQASVAHSQGADIIVFPEDGIYGFVFPLRETIYPFLEYIPSERWNPCAEPNRYPNSDIQVYISCIAQRHHMYVVANFGDKQPCDKATDRTCPPDGRYQFNTDVVYDPDGNYVTKYHKAKLYYEYQFDAPDPVPIISFDTPFGTFGVFTCFDILYEQPAVELIQKYNVSNIVFPTAWMDAGPFLTSVQFHSSFAILHGVNLLAANIHLPIYRFHGSGIYTPNGAVKYYHNTSLQSGGKLLVETIPINSRINVIKNESHPEETTLVPMEHKPFTAKLFKDVHNLVPLNSRSNEASVCHASFCCNVSYGSRDNVIKRSVLSPVEPNFYALAAFSGNHKNKTYYLQICSIVRCNIMDGNVLCGELNEHMAKGFETFTLYGNFSTPYVYPQIYVGNGKHMQLTEYPRKWTFSRNRITSKVPLLEPLGVACLIGRRFELDRPLYITGPADNINTTDSGQDSNDLTTFPVAILLLLAALMLLVVLASGLFHV